ncbi:2-hydroxymuconic semialdehyde hydrolase [Asticcacaulis biprosthecium C19]|uniref:2-hydroxymuconic semialdehyde hydrolase n=1 Tax=Asticcacaulis biprosthecium C19 TaxID=715226 RepID=F4QNS0_9CAUL|nr:alpha/beta hydrolase [Asticcacaulis biprosthecium]EGF90978.1 2-hydroxymuconic semialdehyde hydrolase [Asticcacaulis biprosthecium C19]
MLDLPVSRIRLGTGHATRLFDSGGPGDPVILLHGLALSIEIWGKIIPKLAGRFRVIAFDFPGFGEADRPDATYDSAFFVAQVVAVMDHLSLARSHLVGSSLGGSTVVRLSQNHQARIDRAVVMAPGGFGRECDLSLRAPTLPWVGYALGRPTWLSNAYALNLSMADRHFATRELIDLAAGFARRPGSHAAFVRTVVSGLGPFGVKGTESFARAAEGLHRPVLVLWGEQDRVFPVKQVEVAGRLLPDARVVRIDKCGHYPQWEAPERFVAEVEAFLSPALASVAGPG